jgi:hypothetical protein
MTVIATLTRRGLKQQHGLTEQCRNSKAAARSLASPLAISSENEEFELLFSSAGTG